MTFRQEPISHASVVVYCDTMHAREDLQVYEHVETFDPPRRSTRPFQELQAEFPGATFGDIAHTYEDDEVLVSRGLAWKTAHETGGYGVDAVTSKGIHPRTAMLELGRRSSGKWRNKVDLWHCGHVVKCTPETLGALLDAVAAKSVHELSIRQLEYLLSAKD